MRVAAAGLVTERQLEVAIAITIGLAGVVGLWLALVGGPVLIGLGVLAVVAALAYTGGPFPYGYRALGEVFVFIFFGLVAVVGTAYLQALRFDALFLVAAIPPGALITAILVVNNLRDIPTDTAAGKRTLAVVLGERATQARVRAAARAWRTSCRWRSWRVARVAGPAGGTSPLAPFVLLPLFTLPMATPLLRTVRAFREPRELNLVLKGTARLALAFSLLFALGLALAAGAPAGGGRVSAIVSLRADKVRVPFRRPFPTAQGMWLEREAWIIRLVDADGRIGAGRGGAGAGGRRDGVHGARSPGPRGRDDGPGRAPADGPGARDARRPRVGRSGPPSTPRGWTSSRDRPRRPRARRGRRRGQRHDRVGRARGVGRGRAPGAWRRASRRSS